MQWGRLFRSTSHRIWTPHCLEPFACALSIDTTNRPSMMMMMKVAFKWKSIRSATTRVPRRMTISPCSARTQLKTIGKNCPNAILHPHRWSSKQFRTRNSSGRCISNSFRSTSYSIDNRFYSHRIVGDSSGTHLSDALQWTRKNMLAVCSSTWTYVNAHTKPTPKKSFVLFPQFRIGTWSRVYVESFSVCK